MLCDPPLQKYMSGSHGISGYAAESVILCSKQHTNTLQKTAHFMGGLPE